ncbi:hypothetical protein ITP53_26005 [Nonomuraea sp. K274]|uniref:Uncharacterized protein n=1 Tax=Nonomuraea cypriaca TaxID=1187855 RepID=A0A931AEN4_9ACTN|nr:hypothetical protein [Nonomuraea cypriaca]MBF8189123.1 hypothetical protein [Nonomuraea cypriaca]
MVAHHRKLKTITLTVDESSWQQQLSNWTLENNSEDGEKFYTFSPDGEFREEAEPDYALTLTFFSDWTATGISDYLVLNDGTDADFVLTHRPDVAAETVIWTGKVRIKAPNVGGEARTTETQEVTLQCIGKPVYSRPVTEG